MPTILSYLVYNGENRRAIHNCVPKPCIKGFNAKKRLDAEIAEGLETDYNELLSRYVLVHHDPHGRWYESVCECGVTIVKLADGSFWASHGADERYNHLPIQ